jgi:DNA-binding SARP family transcriptional activator
MDAPHAAAAQHLAAGLRLAGYPDVPADRPADPVRQADELSRLGAEYRQAADELLAAAELHRDSAARVDRQAASVLRLGGLPPVAPVRPAAGPVLAGPVAPVADVQVRVLGELAVRTPAGPVAGWGGQRTRTLFQYLLMHRRPVHREVLMELLWPGYTYSSARNNLNVCVYGLRRAISPDAAGARHVVYRDGCYSLNRELRWDIDRDRFVDTAQRGRLAHGQGRTAEAVAALRRAAAVYGGPLFEGDPAVGWFAPERVALQELFFQVLELLAGLHLAAGDLDGAQGALDRLLREDACRESAHRLLMGCFARRGQGDLVARQYQRCSASLAADLDITPSPATTELYRTLTRPSR